MSTNEAIKVVQPDVIETFRRILSPLDNKWAVRMRDPEYKFTFLEVWGAYDLAPQSVKDELNPILKKEIAWWDTDDFSHDAYRDMMLEDSSRMSEHYLLCLMAWNKFDHDASATSGGTIPTGNSEEMSEEQRKLFEELLGKFEEEIAAEITHVDIGAGMKITDSSEFIGQSIIKLIKGMTMAGSAVLRDRLNKTIDVKAIQLFLSQYIPDSKSAAEALKGTKLEPYAWILEGILSAAKKAGEKIDNGDDDIAVIIEEAINDLLNKAENEHFYDLVEIINRVKSKVDFSNLDKEPKEPEVVAVVDPVPEKAKAIPEPKHATPAPKAKKEKKKEKVINVETPDTAAAMKRIPDEDPVATARNILASPPKVAPGFITQAPINVPPEPKEEEPSFVTVDDLPAYFKDVVNKNPWILKIMNLGIANGVYIQLDPILNSVGDIVAMKFIANNNSGTFIPTKSFSVDFGMVINRALAVWPNIVAGQNGEVLTMPFETCDVAYKLDVSTKNGYEINRPFFNKLFMVGFSGLSSDDRSRNSRYSKQLINANRRLVMITRPNKSNDKEFNAYFNNASFKCAQELDKLAESGSIPKDARFKISLYDPENGSVELTTEGVPQYWLTEANQPLMKFHGFPVVKEGQFVKDEAGREYFYLIKVEG